MNINKYSLTLTSLTVSAILLILAYVLEAIFNLAPCDLCMKQRAIHFMIVLISIIHFSCVKLNYNFKFISKLIILLWLLSLVMSIYHYGIEQNIWLGFTECSSKISFNNDTLKNLLSKDPIRCQDVNFKILNLSLAGWNGLISFSVLILLVYMLFISKKNKYEK